MICLCCSLLTMILQNDPFIHLWGIKVMTDGRRDERGCVGEEGAAGTAYQEIHADFRNGLPDTWKSCMHYPGGTLPLPARAKQSTTISSYAVHPWPPSEDLKLETQSAGVNLHPVVPTPCPLSLHNVERVQWVNSEHICHTLPRERLTFKVLCTLCVCVNLFLFHHDPFIHVKIWRARSPKLLIKAMAKKPNLIT